MKSTSNTRKSHRASSVGSVWPSATLENFHEVPADDKDVPAAWCYTDELSYSPGEVVRIHTCTTMAHYDLRLYRDGAQQVEILRVIRAEGRYHPTPDDCSINGCGWPVAHRLQLPSDIKSGGYILHIEGYDDDGGRIEHHFAFVIKALAPSAPDALLLVACTATWVAYNDWGGSNYYEGTYGPEGNQPSPVVSTQRPFSRGFAWLPEGAPRIPLRTPPKLGAAPRYIHAEWAYANGFSKKYASAGWASYERHFVQWAERQGYIVDVATQHDLHFSPDILKKYKCVVFVGHDEYWSWEMRDAVDIYVNNGGHIARFAGNFTWQVRIESDGKQQVCYKSAAEFMDPVREITKRKHLLTTAWDDCDVGRPGTYTFGLKGTVGIYAGWGACVPRGPGGFTVYRPDHWVFSGTDLYYGDLLGAESRIFGYEVDGCDYTFRHGLPYPTGSDGAPDNLQILAMGLATTFEADHKNPGSVLFIADHDLHLTAHQHERKTDETTLDKYRRGAGMIAYFERGRGAVLNAASCEWVSGLIDNDPFVARTTKNVLDRFIGNAI
jgi:sRNA-binding regulator protein Hfq